MADYNGDEISQWEIDSVVGYAAANMAYNGSGGRSCSCMK